jgi:hypothetical protein
VFLTLEFLQQIGFEVGAPSDFEYLEQAQQRDVMFLRISFVGEIAHPVIQIVETQQSANALAQWVFVDDHGT